MGFPGFKSYNYTKKATKIQYETIKNHPIILTFEKSRLKIAKIEVEWGHNTFLKKHSQHQIMLKHCLPSFPLSKEPVVVHSRSRFVPQQPLFFLPKNAHSRSHPFSPNSIKDPTPKSYSPTKPVFLKGHLPHLFLQGGNNKPRQTQSPTENLVSQYNAP